MNTTSSAPRPRLRLGLPAALAIVAIGVLWQKKLQSPSQGLSAVQAGGLSPDEPVMY